MKNNIILITIPLLIFVLILIFLLFSWINIRRQRASPSSIQPTGDISGTNIPTGIDEPTITGAKISRAPQPTTIADVFDDHHDTALPKDSPIKEFNLARAKSSATLSSLPSYTYEEDSAGKKYTPNKIFYAQIIDGQLIIVNSSLQTTSQFIEVPTEIAQVNFAWLTNDLLLLVEKDRADKIDRVYIVDKKVGKKTFIIGSFPIVARFNLSVNPKVFNQGREVQFTDNEGLIWQLSLKF